MRDSDLVIRVEGLGKKYALHHEKGERYTALRDVVARQARAAGRLLNPFTLAGQLRKAQREAAAERAETEEEFWALKDVSFEIRRGERVGIIGRNGAGKSTLLKILSRITEPTTGRVEILGRVASLLEVGTGFHPELTGRENIYLNGAILGMTRREIRSKFDEIVDFAEVEQFLDTPVKRYSSGMYVRLAFAVAAHLEPEILVVDEVLAVGDASFQDKCIGKLNSLSLNEARSVIFVSHNMAAITSLTSRSIVLLNGRVNFEGKTIDAIAAYQNDPPRSGTASFQYISGDSNAKCDYISRAHVITSYPNGVHEMGEKLSFYFEIMCCEPRTKRSFSFQILNQMGIPATHCWLFDSETPCLRAQGKTELLCTMEKPILNIGKYSLHMYLGGLPGEKHVEVANVCNFEIQNNTIHRIFPWSPSSCVYFETVAWHENDRLLKTGNFMPRCGTL